jgi:hypothetical protein
VANPTKPSDDTSNEITIAANENVTIDDKASSDIFAVGNTVSVTNSVDGDIFAAGNTIDVVIADGSVEGSLRLAGNLVTVDSHIERNALIFGNSVHIGPNAVIDGDTHIYASHIVIDGVLSGPATLGGETVIINGTVAGKTTIEATSAAFGDTAIVKANTDITSPNDVVADNTVTGRDKITTHMVAVDHHACMHVDHFAWWLVSTFFFLLVGIVLILACPQVVERVVHSMQQHPARTWTKGTLAFFLTPIVALILCFTLIGIPLAMILTMGYVLSLLIGRLFVGMYIGYELVNEKRFTHKTKRELTYFVVGYFILSLAMSVPFFGWFVKLLAGIWGMGGLIELLKRKNA